MFTTELPTRVLLTVLLVGLCQAYQDLSYKDDNHWTMTVENNRNNEINPESRLMSSEEESGILLPPDDKYNFVGEDSLTETTTSDSTWRSARNSQTPDTTMLSSNSYSIRPGGSTTAETSVTINTKPISIFTTNNDYNKNGLTTPSSGAMSYYENSSPFATSSNDQNKPAVFVKNNCYGPKCPSAEDQQNLEDEWKSYHYVLNQNVKHKQKRYFQEAARRIGDFIDEDNFPSEQKMRISIPFRVDPQIPHKDLQYPNLHGRNNQRFSRTTTTTPGWVKLQPILPDQYDLFSLNATRMGPPQPHSSFMNQNSQFSDRLGVELNPNSFADRWGWSGDSGLSHSHGPAWNDKQPSPQGSRYPSWLQEIHNQQPHHQGNPTRDQDKNWVKLEPIAVSGVSISKWVPKGTGAAELPSTNWPSRDRQPSSQNYDNPSPSKWWDHIDNVNKLSRPSYGSPPPVKILNHGWGPNPNKAAPSSWDRDRAPTNPWNDIIYPDGPTSATVSWQEDKGNSKYQSSFASPSPSSSPWPSDNRRPPAATGSWSADRNGQASHQYPTSTYGGNRRYGTSSYPDRNTNDEDPRWTLISNSRRVATPDSHRVLQGGYDDSKRYRPGFDKYSDFPFYENPYGNRVGKDVKDALNKISKMRNNKSLQDEAFHKVNATLASLAPVLSLRGTSPGRGSNDGKSLLSLSSTTTAPKKNPAFFLPYLGDGRSSGGHSVNNETFYSTTPPVRQNPTKARKGLSINPVYAAVGAGMIPATMAAVLPMMLGRKRRDIGKFLAFENDLNELTRLYRNLKLSSDNNETLHFDKGPSSQNIMT